MAGLAPNSSSSSTICIDFSDIARVKGVSFWNWIFPATMCAGVLDSWFSGAPSRIRSLEISSSLFLIARHRGVTPLYVLDRFTVGV